MTYIPGTPPGFDSSDLRRAMDYVMQELNAISRSQQESNTVELRVVSSPPDKPREGMIVAADGTNWNPGQGAGQYRYEGGAWVKNGNAVHTHVMANITDAGDLATLDTVALSNMANMTTQRVLGRNSAGTGIPEQVSILQLLNWISGASNGDLLRRGATDWARLPVGTATQVLGVSSGLPAWISPPDWLTLISSVTATAGQVNIDFNNISSEFKHYVFCYESIARHTGVNNPYLTLTADTEPTYASPSSAYGWQILPDTNNSNYMYLTVESFASPASLGTQFFSSSPYSGFTLVLNGQVAGTKMVLTFLCQHVDLGLFQSLAFHIIPDTGLLDCIRFNLGGNSFAVNSKIVAYGIR